MSIARTLRRCIPDACLELLAPAWRAARIDRPARLRYWRWFDATDSWDRARLLAFQWDAMKRLLAHADENVPFYRELWRERGVRIGDIRDYADLAALPLTTKADIREHGHLLLARGVDEKTLIPHETGGTTGTPLRFFYDRATDTARYASMRRWEKYAGMHSPLERMFTMGRPSFQLLSDARRWGKTGERYHGNYIPYMRRGSLAATNLTDDVMARYCDLIEKRRPRFIKGYASGLHRLAAYCVRAGRTTDFIQAALTSSDMLAPDQRETTRQAWSCPVFDRYGLGEEVATAVECARHDGYHIDMVKSLVEILDEEGNQLFGRSGRIIGTCLTNYAMPLIRYDVGDLATLTDRRCPCGIQSLMLASLEGRTSAQLMTPTGRRASASVLSVMVTGIATLSEAQFVQSAPDAVRVRAVWTDAFRPEHEALLVDRLNKLLGGTMSITVDRLDQIPRLPSGKFAMVLAERDAPAGEPDPLS